MFDFKELLSNLNGRSARYLVVGGSGVFLCVSVSSAFHGSLTGPLLFQKQDAVGGTKLNAEDTEAQRKSHRSYRTSSSSLPVTCAVPLMPTRSEERRVGKEIKT